MGLGTLRGGGGPLNSGGGAHIHEIGAVDPQREVRWNTGASETIMTYFTILPRVSSVREYGLVARKTRTNSFNWSLEILTMGGQGSELRMSSCVIY